MTPTVLVLASSTMELSLHMTSIPAAGQTLLDRGGVAYLPSGAGAEFAAAFSALGARAVLLSKLGRDAHGKKLFDYYTSLKIDTSSIKVDPDAPTGLAVNLNVGQDAPRRVVYPGANETLTAENIEDAFVRVNPDALFLTLDMPVSLIEVAARCAERRGVPVFVDPASSDGSFPLDRLPPVEVFFPNEQETEAYTGILPLGVDVSLRASLALYRKMHVRYLILKMGARGSFFYDGKHCDVTPPPPGVKIPADASSLGAMYAAAFTVCYLGGADPKSCMRYATAAASLTGMRGGGIKAFATPSDILAFCREHQI